MTAVRRQVNRVLYGLGLGFVLLAAALGGVSSGHAASESETPQGEIAFAAARGSRVSIVIMRADGRAQRVVSGPKSGLAAPSWSPAGTTLAYCDRSRGWVLVTAGRRSRTMPLGSPWGDCRSELSFSPNGRLAVFLGGSDSDLVMGARLRDGRIYSRLDDDGGADDTTPGDPDWGPAGRIALPQSFDSDNGRIALVTWAPGKPLRAVGSVPGAWGNRPDWSPRGDLIAFESSCALEYDVGCGGPRWGSYDSRAHGVWVVSVTTGRPRRLTTNGRAPSWSPDGRWIAYETFHRGARQVAVMRADGTGVRLLGRGFDSTSSPSWRPSR